jgi:hypothetical protein
MRAIGFVPIAISLLTMILEIVFAWPYLARAGVVGLIVLAVILAVTSLAVSGVIAALSAMVMGDPRRDPYVLPSERPTIRREPLVPLPRSAAAMPIPLHGLPDAPAVSASWPTWPSEQELLSTQEAVALGLVHRVPSEARARRPWVPYGLRLWPLLGVLFVGAIATLMFAVLSMRGPSGLF